MCSINGIHKIFLLSVWLLITQASADLPQLLDIPEGTSPKEKETLQQTRDGLQTRENELFSSVEAHNSKCNSVPSGSGLAVQCNKDMNDLKSKIAVYINDATSFNTKLSAIAGVFTESMLQHEQAMFQRKDQAWLNQQKQLIEQAAEQADKDDQELIHQLQNNTPPLKVQKALSELKPGDVILVNADESFMSQSITYGDILLRWLHEGKVQKLEKYDISHSIVYLKTVNGKRLYLDHQIGDKHARIIDETVFLERYEKRLGFVATPKTLINGQKLWNAAKKIALKDNTTYGIFGKRLVCSDVSKLAVLEASGNKLSPLHTQRWGPIDMTPGNFIDPKTHGRYFVVNPLIR